MDHWSKDLPNEQRVCVRDRLVILAHEKNIMAFIKSEEQILLPNVGKIPSPLTVYPFIIFCFISCFLKENINLKNLIPEFRWLTILFTRSYFYFSKLYFSLKYWFNFQLYFKECFNLIYIPQDPFSRPVILARGKYTTAFVNNATKARNNCSRMFRKSQLLINGISVISSSIIHFPFS